MLEMITRMDGLFMNAHSARIVAGLRKPSKSPVGWTMPAIAAVPDALLAVQ